MFKLPNPPSPQADPPELADFAELLCWERGVASTRDILAYLGRVDDNDNNVGCDDDDDENSDSLDEVMNEIERRETACGGGYPFRLDLEGTVLRKRDDCCDERTKIYHYLLLSTRLNMKGSRILDDIDGAALLEEISAHALKNYLGDTRARTYVFGTAAPGQFRKKVDALCRELHEGNGFRALDDGPVQAKDDKLDAVAWVPFSDSLPGQLIIFAQCKTGTTWDDSVTQLQPDAFIKKWINGTILVNPTRAFCISEAPDRSQWRSRCADAGILLDRCRLVDFCDHIDPALLDKVKRWTMAAKKTANCSTL